jgi:hypothetical protein
MTQYLLNHINPVPAYFEQEDEYPSLRKSHCEQTLDLRTVQDTRSFTPIGTLPNVHDDSHTPG